MTEEMGTQRLDTPQENGERKFSSNPLLEATFYPPLQSQSR